MPPLITASTTKVHSVDENKVGAKNGRKTKRGRDIKFIGGLTVAIRWPEFDSRAGVSRLQPYTPGWLTPVTALGRQLHLKTRFR